MKGLTITLHEVKPGDVLPTQEVLAWDESGFVLTGELYCRAHPKHHQSEKMIVCVGREFENISGFHMDELWGITHYAELPDYETIKNS